MVILWRVYRKRFKSRADRLLGEKEDIFNKKEIFTSVTGIVERIAYAGGWLFGKPEIIAVILAMKTAPVLKEWEMDKMLGRTQFNIWLVGNILSVLSAVSIAQLLTEL